MLYAFRHKITVPIVDVRFFQNEYSLKIHRIFLDIKLENGLFEKIQKSETKNGHVFSLQL